MSQSYWDRSRQLIATGGIEDELRWIAGFTEPTGLGMDRLTPVWKARAAEIA